MISALALIVMLPSAAQAKCAGENGGASVVTEIRAGETLILGDGRAVRLAGVLAPKRWEGGSRSAGRAEMERELTRLVQGKKVTLLLGARKRDRYGRFLAQVIADADGDAIWVQEKLAAAGVVRVMSHADNRICIGELLAHENEARAARRGLWKTGYFAIHAANAAHVLSGLARHYEIVEGRVHSVKEVRGRVYLNFGENWRRDFSVYIPAKSSALFSGEGARETPPLAQLKGRLVRVRGWLRIFNGPSITVTHPEQIEVLGSTAALPR